MSEANIPLSTLAQKLQKPKDYHAKTANETRNALYYCQSRQATHKPSLNCVLCGLEIRKRQFVMYANANFTAGSLYYKVHGLDI